MFCTSDWQTHCLSEKLRLPQATPFDELARRDATLLFSRRSTYKAAGLPGAHSARRIRSDRWWTVGSGFHQLPFGSRMAR